MASVGLNTADRFRIGRVFHDSFAVIGRNFVLCAGLALLFSALPRFAIQFLVLKSIVRFTRYSSQHIAFAVTAGLVAMILASVLQAALVRVAIEDLNGKKPAFGDCMGTAILLLLPTIGIALLATFGAALALLLLIVPGVILFLRWSVAVPVLVQERRGVLGSMARSRDLTKGSRWSLFWLWIILIVAAMAIQLALVAIIPHLGAVAAIALDAVVSALVYTLTAIAPAVCYVELRRVKEGTSVEDLAKIFS